MRKTYKAGIALAALLAAANPAAATGAVRNIVLVHGVLTDGSAWRGVYDILTKDGYRVRVVQEPLTSLADDVAATKRVMDLLDGPIVLVGHSYGGTVITEAGADPKVRALVYVSGLQPDVGESTNKLSASMPGPVPAGDFVRTNDGYISLDPDRYAADVAPTLPAHLAKFLADSQMPVAAAAGDAPVTVAAWHDKPSYAIIATDDRALDPKLAHWMYKRSGAHVTEIRGGHLAYIANPRAVAAVIETAAHSTGIK